MIVLSLLSCVSILSLFPTSSVQALDVLDIITNADDLTTFYQAIQTSDDLTQDLQADSAIFTIFAPTDAAFRSIQTVPAYELFTSRRIWQPDYATHLKSWMDFHMILRRTGEPLRSSDITTGMVITPISLIPEDVVATVTGDTISFTGNAFENSEIQQADLFAGNGVVHKMTAVFVPTPLTLTIPDWMDNFDDFSILRSLVATTGLEDTLRQNSVTLFAPTDSAFQEQQNGGNTNDPALLTALLLNHMVSGVYSKSDLTDGTVLPTLAGSSLSIRLGTGPFPVMRINARAEVQVKDILTANGVFHSIDALLLPSVGSSSWSRRGNIITGNRAGDRMGRAVAISHDGRVVAAGAVGVDDGEENMSVGQVQIRAFSNVGQWEQIGLLTGEAAGDEFGRAVALSADGTIVAVAADKHAGTYGPWSGHVRVYEYTAQQEWKPLGQVLEGTASYQAFGYSIALSADGKTLAVGAIWYNCASGENCGRVSMFRFDDTAEEWEFLGQPLEGDRAGDQFGWSVDVSADGNTVAVGAVDHDGPAGENAGLVRVFEYATVENTWRQKGFDLHGAMGATNGASHGDSFGYSVALAGDGKTVASGAVWSNAFGRNSGQVRVFAFQETELGEQWVQLGTPINGTTPLAEFGGAVDLSLDGRILVASATSDRAKAGTVTAYQYNPSTRGWNQLGPAVSGEESFDKFGYSLGSSADGRIIAAGSEVSNSTGPFAGHVQVFER